MEKLSAMIEEWQEMIKYEKWKVTSDGVATYTMTLPNGKTFTEVPMELGDYVHKLEQKLLGRD
jgi:hypothetical protein